MTKSLISYSNEKTPLEIPLEKLHLDGLNPRLPEEEIGKQEEEILGTLILNFDLEDLAESIANNAYFDEEPMIVTPLNLPTKFKNINKKSKNWEEYKKYLEEKTTKFVVVEGNRRLATIRLLLDSSLREKYHLVDWQKISKEVEDDLKKIPTIVYSTREKVVPYLGVRHIAGIKKWEPYAKARYIEYTYKGGKSLEDIKRMIGETKTKEVERLYLAYRLIQIVQEESEDIANKAKQDNFTYIHVALGLREIKDYLGIPKEWKKINFKNPVPKNKIKNLIILFSLLFGDIKLSPVISDSRNVKDIAQILQNKESRDTLVTTRNIKLALQEIKGEEISIIESLKTAQRDLRTILGMIPNNKTERVKEEVKKCDDILRDIHKILGV